MDLGSERQRFSRIQQGVQDQIVPGHMDVIYANKSDSSLLSFLFRLVSREEG